MESAGARRRQRVNHDSEPVRAAAAAPRLRTTLPRKERGRPIPKFTVNLSLAPEKRYDHIAPQFCDQITRSDLPGLFDELLYDIAGEKAGRWLIFVARRVLCRMHSREETAELRGISRATGVAMHVLVAFNVLLDVLLGCTSGGVRVAGENGLADWRMVHFRALDWGMDRLREIVVELDFVRREGGPVVASSLTYFGYIGVLTGVRKGLSMSLNFRPHHDRSTIWKRLAFRWHQAMVVLGFREPISSMLRRVLLSPGVGEASRGAKDTDAEFYTRSHYDTNEIQSVLSELARSRSTAAYLILCLPKRVYVVEKDNCTASVRESDTFLTAYNHDAADEADPSQLAAAGAELAANHAASGMSEIVSYSLERKEHLDNLRGRRVRACDRELGRGDESVTMDDVMRFVRDKEVSNEMTHYAVVMDPESGKILWRRCYDP